MAAVKSAGFVDTVIVREDIDLLVLFCYRAKNLPKAIYFRPEAKYGVGKYLVFKKLLGDSEFRKHADICLPPILNKIALRNLGRRQLCPCTMEEKGQSGQT